MDDLLKAIKKEFLFVESINKEREELIKKIEDICYSDSFCDDSDRITAIKKMIEKYSMPF